MRRNNEGLKLCTRCDGRGGHVLACGISICLFVVKVIYVHTQLAEGLFKFNGYYFDLIMY